MKLFHEECTILVVEPDPQTGRQLLLALSSWGIEARHAKDLATAVPAFLTWGPYRAVICEQVLTDGSGTVLLRWLREQVITVPFLLISAGSPPDLKESTRFGFLPKPFRHYQLRAELDRLLPGYLSATDHDGNDEAASEAEDSLHERSAMNSDKYVGRSR